MLLPPPFLSSLAFPSFEVERLQRSPPPPSRERYPYPPPDTYYIEEQERQREERLERILQMEREIALLRSNEADSRKPPPRMLDSHHDSYDRRGGEGGYHRRSPPLNYDSYPREREPYRERGGSDRGAVGGGGRGGVYSRLSPVSGDRGSDGPYREPVAYPSQYTGSSGGGGRNPPGVGYSSQSSKGSGGSLPPGWPSGIHDKSNANRPPFTNTGPWS